MIDNLRKLVSLRTVSPLSETAKRNTDIFLKEFGLTRGDGNFWVKKNDASKIWAYSHIDTKPPGAKKNWGSNPFVLTENGDKIVGLGVSDAKFQALNLLNLSNRYPLNVVIDGGEEIGDLDAAKFINQQDVKDFIVVDGFKISDKPYKGMMGQLDGEIIFNSEQYPQHPGRKVSNFFWDSLRKLYEFAARNAIHFNVTSVASEARARSLTLESFSIKFDIRYTNAQANTIYRFIEEYCPNIKQHYPPLGIKDDARSDLEVASFSSPLGKILTTPKNIWIVSGALRENGNHQPNEWIFRSQINEHFDSLNKFLKTLF